MLRCVGRGGVEDGVLDQSQEAIQLGLVLAGHNGVQGLVTDIVGMVTPKSLRLVRDTSANKVHGKEQSRQSTGRAGVQLLRLLDLWVVRVLFEWVGF